MKNVQKISDMSLQFTVFLGKFDMSQVKWNLISNKINFVFELAQKLSNDFRLRS